MDKSNRKMILKFIAVATLLLLLVLLAGFTYLNKIVIGSNAGTLPTGYKLIEANGYRFSTKISGSNQDVPVILLHGFPESSIMWKRLILDLNKIGYYTVAPD